MIDKKIEIIASIGKRLPNMTEAEKAYLIGFLEGFSAWQSCDMVSGEERRDSA